MNLWAKAVSRLAQVIDRSYGALRSFQVFVRNVALLSSVVLVGLVLAGFVRGPTILSKYADTHVRLPDGSSAPRDPRDPVHTGIDIQGRYGQPVIALSDGIVVLAGHVDEVCGIRVVIDHGSVNAARFYAGYCHLSVNALATGQRVKRGEVVGYIGRSGLWGPHEHVHFDLQRVVPEKDVRWSFIDPEPFVIGCFDSGRTYPQERLALTWPVKC